MKYVFASRSLLTVGTVFLVAASLVALFAAATTSADSDVTESPAPQGEVVEVPAPRPVDVAELPLPESGPLTDLALAPGPKPGPLIDVTPHRAPPPTDVAPHRSNTTAHRAPPLKDVTEHRAPRKKKHPCPDVFNTVELCIGCTPSGGEEPTGGDQPSDRSGTTDSSASGNNTVAASSTQPGKSKNRSSRRRSNRDKKKGKHSSSTSKKTSSAGSGLGSGQIGAGGAATQAAITVILTTPQLNSGESMTLSRDQFLHFLLGGFKGEVFLGGSVVKIDITVLRQNGDNCFLIFPTMAVTCEGSAGEGRLLTRQEGDTLRFAVRPLADGESGKHSSEVLDAVKDGGFLRAGKYVVRVKVTLSSGEVETHKFNFDVK